MTNPNNEKCPLYEIDGEPLARVWQIVDFDQSYRLACIAMEIGAHATCDKGDDEDYIVKRFNKRSKLHARLPGAAHATKDDYVFLSAMPLDNLVRFIEILQGPFDHSMAA
ncbi:hypothetical protein [Rhizobium sp. PL01]|uniref:hypothetical protein n=1 Tax=Rhizobium sp. PL01 TaxID=3085631 RepID=UPI002981BAEC|nr:hypothetical protein [Rhizobium sp. PL01]MDW5315512.1 hypothetical protein [Rhizobium sp. PL01]